MGEKMQADLEVGFRFFPQTESCSKAPVHTHRHSHSHVRTPLNANTEKAGRGNPAALDDL